MATLTLYKDALIGNLRHLQSKSNAHLIPVLKADAYGHGISFVLPTLLGEGVTLVAVSSAYEAQEILSFCKESVTNPSVLMMGVVEEQDLPPLCLTPVRFSVHSPAYARMLSAAVDRMKRCCFLPPTFSLPIELKLDTGMHRLGLRNPKAVKEVLSLPHLSLCGVYSHLGNAADEARTRTQTDAFRGFLSALPQGVFTHLAASEGLLRYGALGQSGVRVGLALYGVGGSDALLPVMRFSARVLSVLSVKRGALVGYGSVRAPRRLRLAVLDAGYADGVPPSAEKGGFLTHGGVRLPFFGAVCMDRCTVEIGTLPLSEGDEVTFFGNEAGDTARFAAAAGISPYVLLTARSRRSERKFK